MFVQICDCGQGVKNKIKKKKKRGRRSINERLIL